MVNGVEREFFDYTARGAPFGPDDGTVAPWVVVASLPFAPEIVIPTVRHFARMDLGMTGKYGFRPSFNQSFAVPDSPTGWWVTPYHFGIDQGPVVADDRELPDRPALEHHAPLPGSRRRTAAGGIQRRMAWLCCGKHFGASNPVIYLPCRVLGTALNGRRFEA